MVRTTATAPLAFIFLAGFATFAEARADYPQPTPTFCGTPPLAPLGPKGLAGPSSRDGITGGHGINWPTFPPACSEQGS